MGQSIENMFFFRSKSLAGAAYEWIYVVPDTPEYRHRPRASTALLLRLSFLARFFFLCFSTGEELP